jgi:hypothetical protein
MIATIGKKTEVDVHYHYTPAETQSLYDPGWPEEIEIISVELDGDDIMGDLSDACLDKIEDQIRRMRNEN